MTRHALLAALVLALPAALHAQHGQRAIDRGAPAAADAAIRVWNLAGPTRVVGWDRDSVSVTGTLGAGSGELRVGGSPSALKIAVDAPGAPPEAQGGTLLVRVPRRAQVWVKGGTGDITIEGVAGALDAWAVSGDVTVRGDADALAAETMSGDVTIVGRTGSLRLKTAGGAISVAGAAASLTASSVSGPIRLDAADVVRGDVESVTGTVTFRGGVAPGGELAVLTHAASITLVLPRDLSAAFELRTFDGLLTNRFSGAPARFSRGKPYRFATGAAAARDAALIRVRTLKGDITLLRR